MACSPPRPVAFLAGLLILAGTCRAAEGPRPAADRTTEDIGRWVKQLGAGSYQAREKASQRLWSAGEAAEPALQEALRSPDPEVVRRARDILDKFKYGLYPDTPPAVVRLVEQYRSGDHNARQSAIRELFKAGRPGYAVLLKLAAAEDDLDARRTLFEQIAREGAAAAAALVAEGNAEQAEELLEMCSLAGGVDAALRDYAAYALLRGSLDDKIRRFEDRLSRAHDKQAAEVLVYLYRARGDLAEARRIAEQAGKPRLVEVILAEQGDWKALARALAKKPETAENPEDAASPALKATCYRLAGDNAAAEAELDRAAREDGWSAARPLLFNDRPEQAIAAFVRAKTYAPAVEFLTFRMDYRRAFDLADKSGDGAPDDRILVDVYRARTLYQLGEADKARQVFTRLGEEVRNEGHASQDAALVETEYQLGLKDLAFEHCARVLSRVHGEDAPTWLISKVFPKQTAAARVWLKFFRRKAPGEEAATTLRRVRDLLEDHKGGKDFAALAGEVEQAARELPPPEQEEWLVALADTALGLGSEDLARTYLEKAVKEPAARPAPPWNRTAFLRLGDFLSERKHWAEAAEVYGQAWESDRKQAIPLSLRGWALSQAGRAREGRLLTERAHWLPLGSDSARYELAESLVKHGLTEEARRERDFILRTGAFQSVYVTNVQNRLETEAVARKDFFQAAACCDRVLLAVLQTNASFIRTRAYLSVPQGAHRYRARGHLAAGRLDEARREIRLCLAGLPGDTELPIQLVPELEKAGHKEEAADLFGKVFDFHAGLCREYPGSAWCHNGLAWLAARCRRRLEDALEHAKKATELAPGNAGFMDTLAEVHFQRGEKEEAVATMKKCIELEPKNEYFRKQLARFEAGDPRAEIPEE